MPEQNDLIPIYLFLGFLEAGKTKFIQETLEDKRFNKGEKTLLLICEEGVEEYDISRMPKKNIITHVIEDKSEFTMECFTKLLKESGAERVVVEYNGMWLMDDFYNAMPDDTSIAQVMFFADATTFSNYNSNMRSLVVDKLNVAEMVIFNRFDAKYDPNEFHKVVPEAEDGAESVRRRLASGTEGVEKLLRGVPDDVAVVEIAVVRVDVGILNAVLLNVAALFHSPYLKDGAFRSGEPHAPGNGRTAVSLDDALSEAHETLRVVNLHLVAADVDVGAEVAGNLL